MECWKIFEEVHVEEYGIKQFIRLGKKGEHRRAIGRKAGERNGQS